MLLSHGHPEAVERSSIAAAAAPEIGEGEAEQKTSAGRTIPALLTGILERQQRLVAELIGRESHLSRDGEQSRNLQVDASEPRIVRYRAVPHFPLAISMLSAGELGSAAV